MKAIIATTVIIAVLSIPRIAAANVLLWVDCDNGSDAYEPSSETAPLKTLTKALEKADRKGITWVYVLPSTCTDSVWIFDIPRIHFVGQGTSVDDVKFDGRFEITKGARVQFQNILFRQFAATTGNLAEQLAVNHAHLQLVDCKAVAYAGGDKSFIRSVFSQVYIQAITRTFVINYSASVPSAAPGRVIDIIYHSFLWLGGQSGQTWRVEVNMGEQSLIALRVNSSVAYVSAWRAMGTAQPPASLGISASRASEVRIANEVGVPQLTKVLIDGNLVGIISSTGSNVYTDGPMLLRKNTTALEASYGGSIEYKNDAVFDGNSVDTSVIQNDVNQLHAVCPGICP